MECLFDWDTTKQQVKARILGTVEVFYKAMKEKERGTLKGRFFVWIK